MSLSPQEDGPDALAYQALADEVSAVACGSLTASHPQPSFTLRAGQVLEEPYHYITQVPGKDIRSKLIDAFNVWLRVPEESLEIIKEVTKILHNASLLHVPAFPLWPISQGRL
jgi:hypothetical protein